MYYEKPAFFEGTRAAYSLARALNIHSSHVGEYAKEYKNSTKSITIYFILSRLFITVKRRLSIIFINDFKFGN